jgi:hypothetical protein
VPAASGVTVTVGGVAGGRGGTPKTIRLGARRARVPAKGTALRGRVCRG